MIRRFNSSWLATAVANSRLVSRSATSRRSESTDSVAGPGFRNDAEEERIRAFGDPKLDDATKLPGRLIEHVGAEERNAQIAMLFDLDLEEPGRRRLRGCADALGQTRGDQPEQGLGGVEIG